LPSDLIQDIEAAIAETTGIASVGGSRLSVLVDLNGLKEVHLAAGFEYSLQDRPYGALLEPSGGERNRIADLCLAEPCAETTGAQAEP
jgi:hypothetical protein